MESLTKEKRYDMIDAFNSTSRYLVDLLNIDNIHFEQMVHRIYPAELQLNKANASDNEAAFLDLNLSINNDAVSTKIYDKRDYFDFDIVNVPFLDGDVSQRPSYGVNISQLIRFARASSHVTDFNNHNKFLTAKFLKQGYRFHKLRKAFSKFYRRHFELMEKYHVSLKKNLCNKVFVIQNSMEIWYINLRNHWKSKLLRSFQTHCKPFQESKVYLRHYAADCMPSF